MKNIICPVSQDRVSENTPRITALLVVIALTFYAITGNLIFAIIALADFTARSFELEKLSLFNQIAKRATIYLGLEGKNIDKAPKIFASRLGFVFTSLIIFLALIGLIEVSILVAGILIVFASLECIFNVCVGCYIYSWFVLPVFNRG